LSVQGIVNSRHLPGFTSPGATPTRFGLLAAAQRDVFAVNLASISFVRMLGIFVALQGSHFLLFDEYHCHGAVI
jgi:hypothetical protein